jgi:tetratricopeptide (TPR) repeat protein
MNKTSLLCALALLCTSAAFGQTITVNEIVASHEKALGGRAAIAAVHSIVVRGVYHEGGPIEESKTPLVPRAYQAWMRPYFEHIGDPADMHPDIREGFDGSTWEYYGDPGVAIRTVGAAASAGRHAAEFLDSLVDYQSKGNQLALEGEEDIAGAPAYRIHVTLFDGFEKLTFVDKKTFMIVAERKSAPVHAFGASVSSETRFYGYHPVHGVMFRQGTRETDIATGKILNDFRCTSIEVNTVTDVAEFSPPALPRTPLQLWLEHLYEERADPVGVMHSYRIFRQANSQLETRSGAEFIGYQMVKMGDFKSAIELLKANAADYPQSASAQFGLGRAYKAAGDANNAKRAFTRALEIDPNFKKATDGLNALR